MFCLLVDVLYLICSGARNVPLILFFYFSFTSTKNLNKIKAVCAGFYFVVAAAFRWRLLCAAAMTDKHYGDWLVYHDTTSGQSSGAVMVVLKLKLILKYMYS